MIRGAYRDIIRRPNREVIYDSGWHKNQIVNQCHELVAALMMPPGDDNNKNTPGIRFLRVGSGTEEGWDPETPPPVDTVNLASPYSVDFDELDFTLSGKKLKITAILQPGYPTVLEGRNAYPLREFGLFGCCGGKFYMINYVKHYLMEKEPSDELIRRVVLDFGRDNGEISVGEG
jgi:hypothetical protein